MSDSLLVYYYFEELSMADVKNMIGEPKDSYNYGAMAKVMMNSVFRELVESSK